MNDTFALFIFIYIIMAVIYCLYVVQCFVSRDFYENLPLLYF